MTEPPCPSLFPERPDRASLGPKHQGDEEGDGDRPAQVIGWVHSVNSGRAWGRRGLIEGEAAPMPKESGAQAPVANGGDGVAGCWAAAWGFSPYMDYVYGSF